MWFRPAYPPKVPGSDLEAGPAGVVRPLYPAMIERPELRWAFIRKVYSIMSLQMLLTVVVGAAVVYYRPIAYFFVSSGPGLGLYILTLFMPFIGLLFPSFLFFL
jgi:protein lifeguard